MVCIPSYACASAYMITTSYACSKMPQSCALHVLMPLLVQVDDWKGKVRDGMREKVRPYTDKE